MDDGGNIYGTAQAGGSSQGTGTIYEFDGGSVQTIYTFCQTDCTDGGYPNGITRDSKGNLYGTTIQQGAHGFGTVFKLSP
jgi:uncharacterized repeat protein (TIGR03803 family)